MRGRMGMIHDDLLLCSGLKGRMAGADEGGRASAVGAGAVGGRRQGGAVGVGVRRWISRRAVCR